MAPKAKAKGKAAPSPSKPDVSSLPPGQASWLSQREKWLATIDLHDVFTGIHAHDALTLNDGGLQAPFDAASYTIKHENESHPQLPAPGLISGAHSLELTYFCRVEV